MKKPKTKCELCKCLNLIAQLELHPSKTSWLALIMKYRGLLEKDAKAVASVNDCDKHTYCNTVERAGSLSPFVEDIGKVGDFVEGVLQAKDKLAGVKGA